MKTLLALLVMFTLCSCHKETGEIGKNQIVLAEFASMLSRNTTYIVTDYYTSQSILTVPVVNSDDTYTFDNASLDGWISSKLPCIEYHYNFKVYAAGSDIKMDWLDFSIVPQTYDVYDYERNEWFILRQGDTYVRYSVLNSTVSK